MTQRMQHFQSKKIHTHPRLPPFISLCSFFQRANVDLLLYGQPQRIKYVFFLLLLCIEHLFMKTLVYGVNYRQLSELIFKIVNHSLLESVDQAEYSSEPDTYI